MFDIKVALENLQKLSEFSGMIRIREGELDSLLKVQEEDWSDALRNKKITAMRDFIATYHNLTRGYKDLLEMKDLFSDTELGEEQRKLDKDFGVFYMSTLLSEKYDSNDCIINITAGAGGTEAQDWAEMVFRMLARFCEGCDFATTVTDHLEGEGAGIKGVSFSVKGHNAYGILKSEAGVHRLVRISPFDSNARRHTSFAAVEVVPVIEKTTVQIEEKDLRIDVYRSSGAGGQHVNKTESAVRITHIPTGVVVTCQSGRSQIQNRQIAMESLVSKLEFLHYENERRRLKNLQPVQQKIEWGSQIRSYVMAPYTMVKDHRTGYETSNVAKVLDGDLRGFSDAFLLQTTSGRC